MAKKTTKIEKNATLNIDTQDIKVKKTTKNKAKKMLKHTTKKTWLCAFALLILGICVGLGTFFLVCKDDCFNIIGEDELCFTLSETYVDAGVRVISFGKDISSEVTIETNLSKNASGEYYASEVGTYYIKYMSNDIKFGTLFKIQKIRLITFVENSEGENIDE